MSKPKVPPPPRVDIGADTASNDALTNRAELVGTTAPLTALYLSSSTFKAAVDGFVASGVAVVASESKVTALESQLTQARFARETARVACKSSHSVLCTQVEQASPTAAAIATYGFVALEVVKLGSVLPTGILWSYDHATGLLDLHVKFAGKAHAFVIEISPDPIGAATYRRLDGHGVKQSVPNLTPGTYWIHAATSLADGRSDWFGPVAAILK